MLVGYDISPFLTMGTQELKEVRTLVASLRHFSEDEINQERFKNSLYD